MLINLHTTTACHNRLFSICLSLLHIRYCKHALNILHHYGCRHFNHSMSSLICVSSNKRNCSEQNQRVVGYSMTKDEKEWRMYRQWANILMGFIFKNNTQPWQWQWLYYVANLKRMRNVNKCREIRHGWTRIRSFINNFLKSLWKFFFPFN